MRDSVERLSCGCTDSRAIYSFSWSQALQLPLFDLCKGKGELVLDEMSKLYVKELEIAGAAARGEHTWAIGEGDHVGSKVAAKEPVAA